MQHRNYFSEVHRRRVTIWVAVIYFEHVRPFPPLRCHAASLTEFQHKAELEHAIQSSP